MVKVLEKYRFWRLRNTWSIFNVIDKQDVEFMESSASMGLEACRLNSVLLNIGTLKGPVENKITFSPAVF